MGKGRVQVKLKFARFVRALGKPDWGEIFGILTAVVLGIAVCMFIGGLAGAFVVGGTTWPWAWSLWAILVIPAGVAVIVFICWLFWKLYNWAKNYADDVDKEDARWERGDYDEDQDR